MNIDERLDLNTDEAPTKVFISYSRKDLAFVDRLAERLTSHGITPAIDRAEIYAFEDWWNRIETLIGATDTVIFVLSPDAITSGICRKEVTHAEQLGKRIAPIVCRAVASDDLDKIPAALASLNFIFFDTVEGFDAALDKLVQALRTDIGWIRLHTEYSLGAAEWEKAARSKNLLLRSPRLEAAERWMAMRPGTAPAPSASAHAFISASRRAATLRRNLAAGGLIAGLLVSIGLAGAVVWQRLLATEQRVQAETQRATAKRNANEAFMARNSGLIAQSRFLTDLSRQQYESRAVTSALLLALEALPDDRAGIVRPYLPAAELRLDKAVRSQAEDSFIPIKPAPQDAAETYSRDGREILLATDDGIRIWNVLSRKLISYFKDKNKLGANFDRRYLLKNSDEVNIIRNQNGDWSKSAVLAFGAPEIIEFSPDRRKVLAWYDERNIVRLFDASTGKQLGPALKHYSRIRSLGFSGDGKRFFSVSSGHEEWDERVIRIWDTHSIKKINEIRSPNNIHNAVIDYKGEILAVASGESYSIRNASDGRVLLDIMQDEPVNSVALSRDGNYLLGTTHNTVSVFKLKITESKDTEAFYDRICSERFRPLVYDARFSPDESHILVRHDWGLSTLLLKKRFEDIAMSDNMGNEITAFDSKTTQEYLLYSRKSFRDTQKLVDEAKLLVSRCLTPNERKAFFLPVEPPLWCVEASKWPYDTALWKAWLTDRKAGRSGSLPQGAPETAE